MARSGSGSDTDSDAPARKRLKTNANADAALVPSRMGSTILMESQSQSQDAANGSARPRRTASKRSNLKEDSSADEPDEVEPKPKRAARGKKAAAAAEDGDAPAPKKRAARAKKSTAADDAPLPARVQSAWKVGAHVSAAGGVENAVLNAAKIGAGAFALFLKSQRKWVSPPLKPSNVQAFKAAMTTYGYDASHVLPHGSYLLNLGNADEAKREQSYACFLDDLKRCEMLGLLLYNFHPGSTVGACTVAEACASIASSLNRAHKETARVVTVLENMAGQGNVVGSRFEDLRDIIALVEDKSRVGVCLDTCHMFAAGYDIRTAEAYEKTMAEFDAVVGREYLRGMHLNDSKGELACKKDRHENIGMGKLGLPAFAHIMRDARARGVPLVLETPNADDPAVWAVEIGVLYELVGDAGEDRVKAAVSAMGEVTSAVENGAAKAEDAPAPSELTPERETALVQRIKDAVSKANAGAKKKPAAVKKKVPAKRGRKKKDESEEDEEDDE